MVDGDALVVEVRDRALEVRRGTVVGPDARITGSVGALRELLWRGRPIAEAEADGSVTVNGSRADVRRFLKLFPPPSGGAPREG